LTSGEKLVAPVLNIQELPMSNRPSPVSFRVEPRSIPALKIAFENALDTLRKHIARLEFEGYIKEPWLGDEVSREVCDFYNKYVMDAAEGPLGALRTYQTELLNIRNTLDAMEQEYRRTEGDNTELGGRA